jgi:hypothetical protein
MPFIQEKYCVTNCSKNFYRDDEKKRCLTKEHCKQWYGSASDLEKGDKTEKFIF